MIDVYNEVVAPADEKPKPLCDTFEEGLSLHGVTSILVGWRVKAKVAGFEIEVRDCK